MIKINGDIAIKVIERCASFDKVVAITGIIAEILFIIIKAPIAILIVGVLPTIVALANIMLLKFYNFKGILLQYKSSRTYKTRYQKSNKLQSIDQR